MTFRCHKCKKTFEKTGSCEDCGTALEKNCGVCGDEIDQCTCTGDIQQTKGNAKNY